MIESETKTNTQKRKKVLKNFLFLLAWCFVICKLIFPDLEQFLLNKIGLQVADWALTFQFIFIIIFLLCLWLLIGNKRFLKNLWQFLIFPFWSSLKIICWKIPKFLIKIKGWIFLLDYVNETVKFFKYFKSRALKFFLFILSLLIILNTSGNVLILSILILSFLLISHYIGRFIMSFKPFKMFEIEINSETIEKIAKRSYLKNSIYNDKEDEAKEDEEKINENIRALLFFDALAELIKYKLKKFIHSREYFGLFILKFLYTFILTIIILALVNFALFKISNEFFIFNNLPSFYDFIIYTFYSIIPDETSILPASLIAKFIRMLSTFLGVVITIFLFFVFFTINGDKFKEGIGGLIKISNNQLFEINSILDSKLSVTKEDALQILKYEDKDAWEAINSIKRYMK